MKLRNKKTGEIGELMTENYEFDGFWVRTGGDNCSDYKDINYYSLAELNEEWEDVPEQKKYHHYIEPRGQIIELIFGDDVDELKEELSEIGNYFETKEEAEKAVEKLKAWKRLKDKGFRFEGIKEDYTRILQSQEPFRTGKRYLQFNKSEDEEWMKENWEDLDLLFGGEK